MSYRVAACFVGYLLVIAAINFSYFDFPEKRSPPPNPLASDPRYLEDLPEERVRELLEISNKYGDNSIAPGRATNEEFEHVVAQLLRKYPFQSLVPRLSIYMPASSRRSSSALAKDAKATLDQFEVVSHLMGAMGEYGQIKRPGYPDRAIMLKDLHEGTVEAFVRQQGLGVYRMRQGPHPLIDDHFPVVQPHDLPDYVESKYNLSKNGVASNPIEHLQSMHTNMRDSFVFEYGWGYVRSKEEVAGFQAHRVGRISLYDPWEAERFIHEFQPNERKQWQIDTVQLVGVLKYAKPVVYVLENLPDMDEIKNAPTRELSQWENTALDSLYNGEDLEYANEPEHIKVLGAIRANTECLHCHDGKRGDILGAFTYDIARVRYASPKLDSETLSQISK